MKKLEQVFYNRPDVVKIAKELLGKIIVTTFGGVTTAGRIVETEAYEGAIDRASHAWNGRRTKRTEIMFGEAGHAYVYLCYGIHQMFNVVTNKVGTPHAILIRAIEPLTGIEHMLKRTGKKVLDNTLTRGPGNVAKALGLHTSQTGTSLQSDELYIASDGYKLGAGQIVATPRIGVDYALDHAAWLYRFIVEGNPYVSGKVLKKVRL